MVQGKQAEAERWLGTLPAAVADHPEVAGVRADLAAAAKDWERLARLIEGGAWGPVPPEVVRLAFSANVVSARSAGLRRQVWDETLAAAGGSKSALQVLLRLANIWRWEVELEALLWTIVRVDPVQSWAHGALMTAFQQRGDGKKMLDVITILKNAAPSSATYRHDWALLTLLVSPSKTWDAPKEAAKASHLADPQNPSYATTYALALAQAGKAEEGRGVLEKLSPLDQDDARRAPYQVFVYGHCRRAAEVEKYAARAATVRLLQQETALISLGKEALHRPISAPLPPSTRKVTTAPKESGAK